MQDLHKAQSLQGADRFPDRGLAYPEPVGKLSFVRKAFAMRQPPRDDVLAQCLDDLVDYLHAPAWLGRFSRRRGLCGSTGPHVTITIVS